ncbi:fibrinogen-like protein 1 [Anabrus simplex]|uniref:fibrinogen-like protein 1 n=1 Tax=Anabrus simplex TaxID=316456 RepID=UPI0035A37CC5
MKWFALLLVGLCITAEERVPNRYRSGRRLQRVKENVTQETTEATKYDPFGTDDTGDDVPGQTLMLLQRLTDRLTALQALDEQQIRRLETLEYRLTKLEVQLQEKSDGVRTELREVTRRVQQLDWQASKMDASLEAIKLDMSGLNQGQEHLRGMLTGPDSRLSTLAETELQSKMHMMVAALHGVRGATAMMQDGFMQLNSNVSQLSNMTRHVVKLSDKLVTKQHLKTALLDIQQNSILPAAHVGKSSCGPAPTEERLPLDCRGVQQEGYNQSGVYKIKPPQASQPFFVYCDMETKGGGWTILQNRYEGTVDFYRGWEDYKRGFGNLGGEFWLGLEKLYLLTNHKINELLIELQDFSTDTSYAYYSAFAIGTEAEGYPIQLLAGYDGDAGDSLIYHAGMKFSTYDIDNDSWQDGSCAESHTGAWWYNGCDTSNLNGRYLGGELSEGYDYQGVYWYDWHGPGYSLMKTRMSVRPNSNTHTLFNITGKRSQANTKHRKTTTTTKLPVKTTTEYDYYTEN